MAITTPSNFLALIRRELSDAVEPYLWSDADLYEYMSEIQREFARETKCITDAETFSDWAISSGDIYVDLDPRIVDIKRAVLTTSQTVLEVTTLEDFSSKFWEDDYGYRKKGYWEADTGTPRYLITNYEEDEARLYPIANAADSLDLIVWREPLEDIASTSTAFEIPDKFIYRLIYGIKMLAYSKQDYETFDADGRNENMVLWEEAKRDAQSRVKRKIRRPRQIAYGGL